MTTSIAYLIAAHRDPGHLARLVGALRSPHSKTFVHIDAKSAIDPFRAALGDAAEFCRDPVPVYWGEFSQVDATLKMIRAAMQDGARFDYLVFISGGDYPVCPPEYIHRFLSTHAGTEFINAVPIPSELAKKPLSRLTRYKVESGRPTTAPEKLVRKALAKVWPPSAVRDVRRGLGGLQPYGGSSWWALTREACGHVLNFVEQRPDVVRFFRNSWYPDETFFQTVLCNSPFAGRIRRNLTFTDWRAGGAHPAEIQPHHMERLARTPVMADDPVYGEGELLFARKFNASSADLVDQLDAIIRDKAASAAPAGT